MLHSGTVTECECMFQLGSVLTAQHTNSHSCTLTLKLAVADLFIAAAAFPAGEFHRLSGVAIVIGFKHSHSPSPAGIGMDLNFAPDAGLWPAEPHARLCHTVACAPADVAHATAPIYCLVVAKAGELCTTPTVTHGRPGCSASGKSERHGLREMDKGHEAHDERVYVPRGFAASSMNHSAGTRSL